MLLEVIDTSLNPCHFKRNFRQKLRFYYHSNSDQNGYSKMQLMNTGIIAWVINKSCRRVLFGIAENIEANNKFIYHAEDLNEIRRTCNKLDL